MHDITFDDGVCPARHMMAYALQRGIIDPTYIYNVAPHGFHIKISESGFIPWKQFILNRLDWRFNKYKDPPWTSEPHRFIICTQLMWRYSFFSSLSNHEIKLRTSEFKKWKKSYNNKRAHSKYDLDFRYWYELYPFTIVNYNSYDFYHLMLINDGVETTVQSYKWQLPSAVALRNGALLDMVPLCREHTLIRKIYAHSIPLYAEDTNVL